jgi:hypothetical protein
MKKGFFIPLIAIAVLLAFPASSALAGKTSAVVNGKSYHFNSRYDWNENNYGFGIEHEFKQRSAWKKIAMANGFRDSTNNMSYMAGAGLHRRLYETDKLAGFSIYAGLNAFLTLRDIDPLSAALSLRSDQWQAGLEGLPLEVLESDALLSRFCIDGAPVQRSMPAVSIIGEPGFQ